MSIFSFAPPMKAGPEEFVHRAVAIRDHTLPLLRKQFIIPKPIGGMSLWTIDRFIFALFEEATLPPGSTTQDRWGKYSAMLPYCLWVRHPLERPRQVMSVSWTADWTPGLISFWPGEWEAEALSL